MNELSEEFPHPTVLLLWIRPKQLSFNVLREIHYYLQGPFIAHAQADKLTIFDISRRTWTTTYLEKDLYAPNVHSIIMISSSEVLIAGFTRYKTCVLGLDGVIRPKADMLLEGYPGLYHNQADNTVLAFGGGIRTKLKGTQEYSLVRDNWKMLSCKMKYARTSFTPCQYYSSLYMVGGFASQIESFSLKTFTFAVVYDEYVALTMHPAAVLYDNQIHIISTDTYEVFDLRTNKYRKPFVFSRGQSFIYAAAVMKRTIISGRHEHFWRIEMDQPTWWIEDE